MFYFFSLIYILKLDEPFRNEEILMISLFSKIQICCCSFRLTFCPLDPDPWIRTFLRSRIQEAKILQIQRIRILSTVCKSFNYLSERRSMEKNKIDCDKNSVGKNKYIYNKIEVDPKGVNGNV